MAENSASEEASEGPKSPPLCWACEAVLRSATQKRCTECGSFQGRRKALNFSVTILSLLVALISVSSAAVPTLVSFFSRPMTEITIAAVDDIGLTPFAGLDEFGIFAEVVIQNTGDATGAIVECGFDIYSSNGDLYGQRGTRSGCRLDDQSPWWGGRDCLPTGAE